MMGMGTYDPHMKHIFEHTYMVFLIIFTIKSGMQLIYHGYNMFKDGFLVFDLAIMVMSWVFNGSQVVRAFHIFSALHLQQGYAS